MKKFAFIFSMVMVASLAFSQGNVMFNHNYTYQWQYDCNSMLILDSSYFLSGNIARLVEDCEFGIPGYHVTKISSYGINDTTIVYDKCGQTNYTGWHGTVSNNLNEVLLGGLKFVNFESELFLLKLSFELDTISCFVFYHDTTTKRPNEVILDKTNNYILCGAIDSSYNELINPSPSPTYTKSMLIKISPIGEIIWKKSYSMTNCINGCWSGFINVINTYDNGFIAIGPYAASAGINKNAIVKVDSLGNQKWVKYYGNPNYDNPYLMDIVETQDSCIVVCGAYPYDEIGGGLYPYDGWLIKLDKDGNEKWNRKHRDYVYGSTDWRDTIYSFYYGLVEKPNHDILAICGTRSDDEHNYIGERFRLRCLDSIGNKKWDKVFTSVGNQQGPLWPNSIRLTDDGGIAIAGWGEIYYWNEQNQWTSDQRIFLIKTDSLGNDVETTVKPIAAQPISKFELVCYPNPASGEFWLDLPEENNGDVLEIYATNGSLVYEQPATPGVNRIDLCGVRPGMYLVKMRNANVFGKVVVE